MQVPCGYGEIGENGWCKYLKRKEGDVLKTYVCSKYEIITKDPNSKYTPAFGAGCCSNLNSQRRDIIRQRHALEIESDINRESSEKRVIR